jgi:hypothetical protein
MCLVRVGGGKRLELLVLSCWDCLDEFPQLFDLESHSEIYAVPIN